MGDDERRTVEVSRGREEVEMKPKICARFLCKNEVVLPRIKYCSNDCRTKYGSDLYRSKNKEKIREAQRERRKHDAELIKKRKKESYKRAKRNYMIGQLPKWMYS